MSLLTPTPTPFTDVALSTTITLILTIIGVVLGELALYPLLKKLEKPKILIKAVHKDGNLFGFSIQMLKKNVLNARVRCNHTNCFWEEKEGRIPKKDLMAGDDPSFVYPFIASGEVFEVNASPFLADELKGRQGLLLKITETESKKLVFIGSYFVPISAKIKKWIFTPERVDVPNFNVSLTIIGEGIEEKKEYVANVTLSWVSPVFKDGKPDLHSVDFEFVVEERKRLHF